MNKQDAEYMNGLCREIRQDDNALAKRLELDMAAILGIPCVIPDVRPATPEPMESAS